MRESRNPIFFIENGEFKGISLGADFCSEHEWGIKGIKRNFSLPEIGEKNTPWGSWWKEVLSKIKNNFKHQFGIETRTISQIPDNLSIGESVMDICINPKESYTNRKYEKRPVYYIGTIGNLKIDSYIRGSLDNNIKSYWCENAFLIISDNKEYIDSLWNGFQNKDIAIFLGGGGPFENPGLAFLIVSKLDDEFKELMYQSDMDAWELKKAAVKSGIYEKLEKANCEFMALSPSWDDKDKKTLSFWLNPRDQRNNKYGWYGIKELEQWINGKGPIPIKNN